MIPRPVTTVCDIKHDSGRMGVELSGDRASVQLNDFE
jgi:hypothetical protein